MAIASFVMVVASLSHSEFNLAGYFCDTDLINKQISTAISSTESERISQNIVAFSSKQINISLTYKLYTADVELKLWA